MVEEVVGHSLTVQRQMGGRRGRHGQNVIAGVLLLITAAATAASVLLLGLGHSKGPLSLPVGRGGQRRGRLVLL